MRVVVTGHEGYVGSVLVPMLLGRGHEVVGIDAGWLNGSEVLPLARPKHSARIDIRLVDSKLLEDAEAVIHLAAISNDPVGNIEPRVTLSINHHATVRLANLARKAVCTDSFKPPPAVSTARRATIRSMRSRRSGRCPRMRSRSLMPSATSLV